MTPHAKKAPDDTAVLDDWQVQFDRMSNHQQELVAANEWISGPADIFGIVGHARREVLHSAMLGWLLDSTRPHGLGTGLLAEILKICFADENWYEKGIRWAHSRCEVATSNGVTNSRADIVVDAPELHLVIEVKVDAEEGDKQCLRLYRNHFHHEGARFIFLTPNGCAPVTSLDEASGQFQTLSFGEVRRALQGLVSQAESATLGSSSVTNYLLTLEAQFG